MKHLTTETCKLISEKLGKDAPKTLYFHWGERGIYTKSQASINSTDEVERNPVPAYGVEEILMPSGILEKLSGERNGHNLSAQFLSLWHISGWEEAEKYLISLL